MHHNALNSEAAFTTPRNSSSPLTFGARAQFCAGSEMDWSAPYRLLLSASRAKLPKEKNEETLT